MSNDPKDAPDELDGDDDVFLDDPFVMFSEWSSEADEKAYANL
jgi:hypothetical protein